LFFLVFFFLNNTRSSCRFDCHRHSGNGGISSSSSSRSSSLLTIYRAPISRTMRNAFQANTNHFSPITDVFLPLPRTCGNSESATISIHVITKYFLRDKYFFRFIKLVCSTGHYFKYR
jgi:hypothetical protein